MRQQAGASKTPWIVLAVVIIVVAVALLLFKDKITGSSGTGTVKSATSTSPSDWYSVFLTNGQVYFGKLSNADSSFMRLSDVFYLQVGPQQGSGAANQQPNISLVELGGELHGPTKEMEINSAHVLFYERMKSNAKVVEAINQYKTQGSAPATPAQ